MDVRAGASQLWLKREGSSSRYIVVSHPIFSDVIGAAAAQVAEDELLWLCHAQADVASVFCSSPWSAAKAAR